MHEENVIYIDKDIPNCDAVAEIQKLQAQVMHRARFGDEYATEELFEKWFSDLEKCPPKIAKSLLVHFASNLSIELLTKEIPLQSMLEFDHSLIEAILQQETVLEAKELMKQVLQQVCEYMAEQKKTVGLAKEAVQYATQYIDEHYAEKIKIETIANAVYLSPGYLMSIFKKEKGMSVVSYLRMRRMEKAKELLLEKNLKVYEVAERVGYDSANFFYATFRDYVGMSPKQFKEEHLSMK